MGRAAAKVESIETVLQKLSEEAEVIGEELQRYKYRRSKQLQTSWGNRESPGEVVGQLNVKPAHLAKAVEPDRLKFWDVPTFHAEEFLDEKNRAVYLDPLSYASPPDHCLHPPPHVRVRIASRDKLALLKKLDSSNRLALVPARAVRKGYENGLFTVPKDGERDRMVLDARPPNCLESNDDQWIRSLGSLSQLQHFFLEPFEELRIFAEDLREYYHAFCISPNRVLRNALKMTVRPEQVADLKAYRPELAGEKELVPCLATLAMGDSRAVSFGQAAHLAVLLRSGGLRLQDFICLAARPPRQRWVAGLMIDDLVLLQAVPKSLPEIGGTTVCEEIMRKVRDSYEAAGLPRHSGKAVYNESRGSFWGAQVDGEEGVVTPNLNRAIPLAFLLLEVVSIGHVTVGLLEVLAGSLVAVFQLRRRFMSILQEVYSAQRGRREGDVVKLSSELRDELLSAIALIPLSCIDLRLRPSQHLICSDASSRAEAAVRTKIGKEATSELQKYALQKCLWNKLLSPGEAYFREKGLIEEEGQLPQEEYVMHPAWREIVRSKQFEQFGKTKRVQNKRHINIGEMRAALTAEARLGEEEKGSYYVHLQDSQVSLAALVKGRSSSRSLNQEMRRSIPQHVSNNTRPFYGFVRSGLNPSDDPTRQVALRKPVSEEPAWLEELQLGKVEAFDEAMKRMGSHLSQMTGLPDERELQPRVEVDLRTMREVKVRESKDSRQRKRQKTFGDRKEAKVEEQSSGGAVSPAEDKAGGYTPPLRAEALSVEETGGCLACGPAVEETAGPTACVFAPSCRDEKRPTRWRSEGQKQVALEELRKFERSQFLWSREFGSLEEAWEAGPGVLDLFSGSRGFAKAITQTAPTWVLTFDLAHSDQEDLSSPSLQNWLIRLISLGIFAAMAAGPVCASFSTAITPPVRTHEYPEGVPWCSQKQRAKNELGNNFLAFMVLCAAACLSSDTVFFVENPDGSWMWRQVRRGLEWKSVLASGKVGDFRTDFCRYGTPWRKRTRFRTSTHLAGQKLLCCCTRKHVVLRGRCKARKANMTKVAEPYPRGLCRLLATAVAIDAGLLGQRRKLDVNMCARQQGCRIGEAKNPGPRRPRLPRRGQSLADVELLEPATIEIRSRILKDLLDWFEAEYPGADFQQWLQVPLLVVHVLVAFGYFAFSVGCPLHYYRQLLAHMQREFPQLKVFMSPAWDTVSRWQLLEPTQHRVPMPEPLLRAMAALGISWKWFRWSAVLLGCFFSMTRIGEFIRAQRKDVLLPSDILEQSAVIYVKIPEPKTRRRGARVQYATIEDPEVVLFLSAVWTSLKPEELLFGGTPGAFRSRWDAVLRKIGVGAEHRLTPGSLRGGGAVAAHKKGAAISDLLWRMRLQHQHTLSFYLQETTAVSILPVLLPAVRVCISDLRDLLPTLMKVVAQQRTAGTELVSLSLGSSAASVTCGFLESATGPAAWKVKLHSPGEASETRRQCILYKGELPRRDIWVDDDEYRLVTCEPPAISLTTGTIDHWRRALEISLALEKLAQQLRATSLASLDGGQISDWVTKLRTMAEAVTPPRPDKNTLQALSRLPPAERAAMATRLRGLSGGLQRTANAIKDAAELHHAAEQEPSSAAWLRRASQMKYGVKVLQRAKKNLEAGEDQDLWLKQLDTITALQLPVIEQELPSSMVTGRTMLQEQQELQRLAPELRKLRPSEALYACGATGVALRCRRSDAAEVEPWLLVVEHVSLSWVDTASAALTLDSGYHLRDDAGEVAPDVAVLACEPREFYHWFVTSEMYKSYLAMVFTRNPLGQVPGQPYALPVIVWVKTAELLIGRAPRAPRDAAVMPKEEADWFRQMLRTHLMAMHTVKQLTQGRGSMEQLAEALSSPEPAAALTEAEGGPQSVCLALAACCFAKNALPMFWGSRGLERANSRTLQRANSKTIGRQSTTELIEDAANWPRRLRRLALAMMAEAVSRACRRLVRSLCTPETEANVLKKLLWNALGVEESSIAQVTPGESEPPELAKPEGHSDDCDAAHVQRRSALLFAPQGKYFQVALTNCTPQGVAACLPHVCRLQSPVLTSGEVATL
eukprot:s2573_g7.t1